MAKVKVITGYVPIKDHPRTPQEYGELGDKLAKIRSVPVKAFYGLPNSCWLTNLAWELGITDVAVGDNPAKNTMAYHAVNHQKIEWLALAAEQDLDADVFVWIDYGIFHVPGVTVEVVEDFLRRVANDPLMSISIPGCPGYTGEINDEQPWWHFCGGLMVVPRQFCSLFAHEFRTATMQNMMKTKKVTWEVNDLARLARTGRLPFRWYEADHNETMFTNY